MQRKINVFPEANADILDLARHIGEDHPIVADEFIVAVDDLFNRLREHPKMGVTTPFSSKGLENIRMFRVSQRFDHHLVFYIPRSESIDVVRVIYSSRDVKLLFN